MTRWIQQSTYYWSQRIQQTVCSTVDKILDLKINNADGPRVINETNLARETQEKTGPSGIGKEAFL